ncbi:hypothetical protein EKH55_3661 [Sinorhizobium alkalisoli]|nr:hypothetical protein EKH55_3661 [Sinorhizobium alkalisoli]
MPAILLKIPLARKSTLMRIKLDFEQTVIARAATTLSNINQHRRPRPLS